MTVYCTAPWNGITVRENGDVKTCCIGNQVLGNLNKNSIHDILKSDSLRNIQEKMSQGEPDYRNCASCVRQEQQTGLSAIRQHYLKFYPHTHPDLQLKNLDIRWNNLCNLGCVYCSPTFSSVWESRRGQRINLPVKNYQDELLEFILENADQVNEIMLVGGEPMLMKQNYKLLEALPKDTNISIITNFSYELDRLPCIESLLNRPKDKIKWNLSLENSGEKFEYVRNGASWQQVEKNLEFLSVHWPDSAGISLVYSMFTAFDLVDFIKVFHQYGIKKYSLQTYYGPSAMNVAAMPKPIRSLAATVLQDAFALHQSLIHPNDRDLYPFDNYNFVLDQLTADRSSVTITKAKFYDQVSQYDQWNSTKFVDLWPHVAVLVDQHLC